MFAILFFGHVGCGRNSVETNLAKVRIQLQKASSTDLALRQIRPDSWWRSAKTSEPKEKLVAQLASQGTENWGLSEIASTAEIDCFAIAIDVPEDGDAGICTDDSGIVVANISALVGPVAVGQAIELVVPAGAGRTIYAVGLKTDSGQCSGDANLITSFNRLNLAPPMIIGSATVDLAGGDNVIAISGAVTGAEPEIEDCSGGGMNWSSGSICQEPTIDSAAMFSLGAGTVDSPWLICNGTQFNAIGLDNTKWADHFKLMNNIDLSSFTGTSYNVIGNTGVNFTGSFNGNEYTIDGFTYTDTNFELGLFGVASSPAIIQDLYLTNVNLNLGGQGGAILGDGSGVQIENVYVSGVVNNTTSGELGCIVGICSSCTLNVVDSDCAISSAVGPVGGIAGNLIGSSLTDSDFSGSISLGAVDDVGGIVGSMSTGTTITHVTVSANVSGRDHVGGVAGFSNGGGSMSIDDASVSGNISANAQVGGVLGDMAIGGVPISNSTVTGNVTGTGNGIGGIAGNTSGGGSITDSYYFSGTVSGVGSVGGIVGNNIGGASVILSRLGVASATILASGNVVGGIAGANNVAGNVIKQSFVNASITAGGSFAGGIAGTYSGTIQDVYSMGSVSALDTVGGIVGRTANAAVIDRVYSLMTITASTASAAAAGGIVGDILSGNMNPLSDSWFGGSVNTNTAATDGSFIFGNCTAPNCTTNGAVQLNSTIGTCTNSGGGSCFADDSDGSSTSAQLQLSTTVPPYGTWNFGSVWEQRAGKFPGIRNVNAQ